MEEGGILHKRPASLVHHVTVSAKSLNSRQTVLETCAIDFSTEKTSIDIIDTLKYGFSILIFGTLGGTAQLGEHL